MGDKKFTVETSRGRKFTVVWVQRMSKTKVSGPKGGPDDYLRDVFFVKNQADYSALCNSKFAKANGLTRLTMNYSGSGPGYLPAFFVSGSVVKERLKKKQIGPRAVR